uniref:Uncharacterized protein n=1 Tax=Mycena chlorophos TaxID=658473 RepID=A0ABQ0L4H6_MYCCL|nr:predicted protein [Mycena chlorophos]
MRRGPGCRLADGANDWLDAERRLHGVGIRGEGIQQQRGHRDGATPTLARKTPIPPPNGGVLSELSHWHSGRPASGPACSAASESGNIPKLVDGSALYAPGRDAETWCKAGQSRDCARRCWHDEAFSETSEELAYRSLDRPLKRDEQSSRPATLASFSGRHLSATSTDWNLLA